MGNIGKLLNQIKVQNLQGNKIRIGNERDGGYVALEHLCKLATHVYSFGVGNDVGFEIDWVRRFPETKFELFDPTIDCLPQEHRRFTFHRFGFGVNFKPFEQAKENSLLKVDVEWSEWGVLPCFAPADLAQFSQILIECHFIHAQTPKGYSPYFTGLYNKVMESINEDLFCQYCSTIEYLNRMFYIFHIHANNSLPLVCINGYRFPPLLEISFARKDLVERIGEYTGTFPIQGLDFPNKIDRPDVVEYYPWR